MQRALDTVDSLEQRIATLTQLLHLSPVAAGALRSASLPRAEEKEAATGFSKDPSTQKTQAQAPHWRNSSGNALCGRCHLAPQAGWNSVRPGPSVYMAGNMP